MAIIGKELSEKMEKLEGLKSNQKKIKSQIRKHQMIYRGMVDSNMLLNSHIYRLEIEIREIQNNGQRNNAL